MPLSLGQGACHSVWDTVHATQSGTRSMPLSLGQGACHSVWDKVHATQSRTRCTLPQIPQTPQTPPGSNSWEEICESAPDPTRIQSQHVDPQILLDAVCGSENFR